MSGKKRFAKTRLYNNILCKNGYRPRGIRLGAVFFGSQNLSASRVEVPVLFATFGKESALGTGYAACPVFATV